MRALTRAAIRFRWVVVLGWIALIVVLMSISGALGGSDYKDKFELSGTETNTVAKILTAQSATSQTTTEGFVVLKSRTGALTAPPAGVVTGYEALCTEATTVRAVSTPWGAINCATTKQFDPALANPTLVSTKDLSIAITIVSFPSVTDTNAVTKVYDQLRTLRGANLQVEFTGDVFAGQGAGKGINPSLLGFVCALIILALVFRSAGAVALPLLSAVFALLAGLALIAMLSHVMNVSKITPPIADLMVIGVGVDYALFIVTRHRRNLLAGMPIKDSIVNSLDTAGRAVIFAGFTVCIAMLGLLLLGVSFFYGMAIGVAIAVALTVLTSLTLIPALLSVIGLRVLTRSQRRLLAEHPAGVPERITRWHRWAEFSHRYKVIFTGVSVAVIVVIAIPFFSLRFGHADQSSDRSGSTTRAGYDLISTGFGVGYNSILTLVVTGPDAAALAATTAEAIKSVPDVDPTSVAAAPVPPGSTLSFISLKSLTSPQDKKTTGLVNRLRHSTLPPLYAGTSDHVYVYGQTAIFADFTKVLSAKMGLFVGGIVTLSFLLLLVAFRSLVVPLTAAAMNLLAAGASFGIVVAVFQWGWFSDLLGVGGGGPIEAFAPVLFFAILFGLSMDYQVFLVSRMHEEWVHSGDNDRAVNVGVAETGGIITAAALIMIFVFGGFLLGDERVIKLIGLGLSSAIFIDAFILRTMMVPGVMHLAGRANWYFPKWLDRVTPHVSIEGPSGRAPAADVRDAESQSVS